MIYGNIGHDKCFPMRCRHWSRLEQEQGIRKVILSTEQPHMVAPGYRHLIRHHENVMDYTGKLCSRDRRNTIEECEQVNVESGLNGQLSQEEMQAWNWRRSAQLEKAS